MSKSLGNVVNPFHAISRFGTDTMRYYLCHDGGIIDDGDYSNEEIITRYTKNLQSQIGSLVSRVCSKTFDVEEAVVQAEKLKLKLGLQTEKGNDGEEGESEGEGEQVGGALKGDEDNIHSAQMNRVSMLADVVKEKMSQFDFSGALKAIGEVVSDVSLTLPYQNPIQTLSLVPFPKININQKTYHSYNPNQPNRTHTYILTLPLTS